MFAHVWSKSQSNQWLFNESEWKHEGVPLWLTPIFFFLIFRQRSSKKPNSLLDKNNGFDLCFCCFSLIFLGKIKKTAGRLSNSYIYFFFRRRRLGLAKNPTPIRGYFLKIVHSKPNSPSIFWGFDVGTWKSPRRRRERKIIRKCFETYRCVPKIASPEARNKK